MPDAYAELLERSFGFPFPDDFFRFHDFLLDLQSWGLSLTEDSLDMAPANVFQIFEGTSQGVPANLEMVFERDPPEFVTLLLGGVDGLHWGYYVDSPGSFPYPVVHYYHNDSFELEIDGDLLDAVFHYAVDMRQHLELQMRHAPPSAVPYHKKIQHINAVMEVLAPYLNHVQSPRQITAPTRDGMGIIVPAALYAPILPKDPFQEASYRPTSDEIRHYKALALAALQQGHPGAALKLGKDLWDYAEFFDVSCELLACAYQAMGQYVLQNRLEQRRAVRSPSKPKE